MPLGCSEFIDDLIDYADGELAPDRASSLVSHLHACEGCRAALTEIRSMIGVLSETPALPPESYFASLNVRVMDRIRSGEAETWWRKTRRYFGESLWRPVAALTPVAAAIAVGLFVVLRAGVPDLPTTSDEIGAIVKQVRFYSPQRQLHLLPIAARDAESSADPSESPSAVLFAKSMPDDDDTDLNSAFRDERVYSAVPVGFTAPVTDMTDGDVNELKDCLDEAFDSWNI